MAIDNWKQTSLGEQVDLLTGFPFKSAEYTEDVTGIPLVRGDNVVQGMFRWDDVKRWSREKVEILSDYFLNKNDVVLAMDRPWIEAGLKYACVSEYDIPCLLVQRVSRLRAKTTLDQKFLRYVIGSPEFTNYILGTQTGTAVPHISSNQIKGYKFLLPPLPEQRAIAGILGALDDKIEVNRRMNVTLESMARAIFRQWFVDGEDIGKWEVGAISDLAIVTSGKRPDARQENPDIEFKYPLYGGGGIMAYANKSLYDFPILLTGRVGTLGLIFRITTPCWASDNTLITIPNKPEYYEFLYFQLEQTDLKVLNRGSTQPLLTQTDLQKCSCVLPKNETLFKFHDIVSPMFSKIDANNEESRTLGSLRDSLLPKLMRGEVRVSAL